MLCVKGQDDMTDFKYSEEETLLEVAEYIKNTYKQHYVGPNDVQTIDVWASMGIAEQMCLGTAIKYPMRFGLKDGKNKKDILKAIHYLILAYHFAFNSDESSKHQRNAQNMAPTDSSN